MNTAINVHFFTKLSDIISDWAALYQAAPQSQFSSPQWHKVVLAFLAQKQITKRTHQLVYFKASAHIKTSEQLAIGFFYIKTILKKQTLVFGHLAGPSDYYNFVVNHAATAEFLKNTIMQIAVAHKCTNLQFAHIKQQSILFSALSMLPNFSCNSLKCVAIALPNSYAEQLQTRTKNAKQNLRTAHNRLLKSELKLDFTFLNQNNTDTIDFSELKAIYKQRNVHKKQPLHLKSILYKWVDYGFQKELDLFDLQQIKKTNFVLGIVRIDTKIAAYFFGLPFGDTIEINRVSINGAFSTFSPGIILLDEFIKNSFSNNFKYIDLTVGDEKYKYDLGGQTHTIFNCNCTL